MDSDTSSSHHHTSPTHNLPSHTTTILHSQAPDQAGQTSMAGPAGWQQPHPSSHPTESVSLASLSKDERKELLRSLMFDPDMREELPGLLEPALQVSINPLLPLKGDLCLPPASPPEGGALTSRARELDAMSRPHSSSSSSSPEVTSPASPLNNGPVGRQRCGGSLSSEVSGRTSTSGIASSPESSLTRHPERQTSSSSQGVTCQQSCPVVCSIWGCSVTGIGYAEDTCLSHVVAISQIFHFSLGTRLIPFCFRT